MSLHQQLKPLLQQFTNSVGRGNLIAANSTLVAMIEQMAKAIDAPCTSCACAPPSFQPALPIMPVQQPTLSEAPRPITVVEKRGRGRPKKAR